MLVEKVLKINQTISKREEDIYPLLPFYFFFPKPIQGLGLRPPPKKKKAREKDPSPMVKGPKFL